MISTSFIKQLKKEYTEHDIERRKIIGLSSAALHDAKRIIFSLHRGDIKKAEELLAVVEKTLTDAEKEFGAPRLNKEGSYRAAAEEYVEAKMFYRVGKGEKIEAIQNITLDAETYLGGISDLTGELVRRAINLAAEGKFDETEAMKKIINDIMAEMVEFDMTGYQRTKYDQAKGNLRKIEQVCYEIKIRKA
jgi:predicted translin family RNA/ssDNA-binding protein